MIVAIAESLDDIRHDVDAAHAALAVSLEPEDQGRGLGYARGAIAAPVARHEGVAVVLGDEALSGVPDPVRIVVRSEKGPDPTDASLCVRRNALPLLVHVDPISGSARVLRRLEKPKRQDTLPPVSQEVRDVGQLRQPDHGAEEDSAAGGS